MLTRDGRKADSPDLRRVNRVDKGKVIDTDAGTADRGASTSGTSGGIIGLY